MLDQVLHFRSMSKAAAKTTPPPEKTATGVPTDEADTCDRLCELEATYDAIKRAQAVIEFNMDGTIITANDLFLNVMGYALDEIQGKHHSMFAEPAFAQSPEYASFWDKLRHGEYQAAEYKRLGKNGKEVWIQASYNPILAPDGTPMKVVKFATDITARKIRNANYEGQIQAIRKSMAVIEFNMDGSIIDANDIFLSVMGYTREEIQGKHHSMFAEPDFAASAEYQAFWDALRRGEFQAAEYKRLGKDGKEVYIQASYNPILDQNDKPFKVVKFATDITTQMKNRLRRAKAMEEVNADLTSITGDIASVNEQVTNTASAATQTSGNVQAMASAVEQMSASIQEISAQVSRSTTVANDAVEKSRSSNAAMSELSEAAKRIGDVVDLINDIAAQTNLLALNATIEAARAGEAGKGFAVVASEVKNLASQTAKATEEISKQILGVQESTSASVTAIEAVTGTIEEINEISNSIAAAVEEQSKVTDDISSNMQTASEGVDAIAKAGAEIADAVRNVEQSTLKVKGTAQQFV